MEKTKYSVTYTGPDGKDKTTEWRDSYSDVDVINAVAKLALRAGESITILKNGIPTFRVTMQGSVQTRPTKPERRCVTELFTNGQCVACPNSGTWYHKRYSGPVCQQHKEANLCITGETGWSQSPITPEHHIETVE